MSPNARRQRWRAPALIRIIRGRPRLFLSGLVGLVVLAVLPTPWRLPTRGLIAWDLAISLYLILAFELMAREKIRGIRLRAAMEDEGQFGILVLSAAAAFASLGAIIVELSSSPTLGVAGRQPGQMLLAMLTILLSWAFIHMIFALHYAHEFYGESGEESAGLEFPGDDDPDYLDFVYFSFVIGMTSQVSDVAITGKSIRRVVSVHAVLSFLFNTALLALTINIAASAL